MKRTQLFNAVFWPENEKAWYGLISPEGEDIGRVKLDGPIKGSAIAALMPSDWTIQAENIVAVDLKTQIVIGRPIEFDTEVVTERKVMTVVERLDRMEQRERRALQRTLAENARLKKMMAERPELLQEDVVEPVNVPEEQPAKKAGKKTDEVDENVPQGTLEEDEE